MRSPTRAIVVSNAKSGTFRAYTPRFELSYRIMKVEHDTAKAKRSRPTLSLGRKLPPPFVLIASGV
jgi:hypothetical protein